MDNMIEATMKEYGISLLPKDVALAMAYIPFQSTGEKQYSPEQALEIGTVFPSLDKPFLGGMKR